MRQGAPEDCVTPIGAVEREVLVDAQGRGHLGGRIGALTCSEQQLRLHHVRDVGTTRKVPILRTQEVELEVRNKQIENLEHRG